MAPLSNHVSISITQDSVGVARAGFGKAMILSASAAQTDTIAFYSSLAEVAEVFVAGTPEYLAAESLFSQSPRPEEVAIGVTDSSRRPTQVYSVAITARNSHVYSIDVVCDDGTTGTATYTSDASATQAEIAAGLVTALNGIAGNNYTAAGSSSPITITADAAGDWFSLSMDAADLQASQTHVDPGVATDLAAINVVDSSWYCLITLYNSDAYVKAAAAWVEANKKIYIADLSEGIAVTTASDGTQGTADDLMTLGYARTAVLWNEDPSAMAGAAWAGRCLPIDPGGETWKFKTLAGVAASTLTSTQRTNLVNRNANFIETVAGVKITSNGTTADGDFIDVRRGLDWLEDDMTASVFEALAGANKIPFTDAGVAVIEGRVIASLKRALANGIIADDPAFVVTVPKVSNVSAGNKALRNLPDVRWSATLAGAVHKVVITGVVSV